MLFRYTIARMKVLAMLLLAGGALMAQTGNPAAAVPRMEEALKKTIVDFWYPKSIDKAHGGYTIRFNADGSWKGDGPKMIVTQARHVWMFARLARAGYGDRQAMLAAADHGYRFLTTKMWDSANGGFYQTEQASLRTIVRALRDQRVRAGFRA
jgi:mannose/cellobiose epimerase-like protein (N-acyl-D-glucosamine 2-epimerase family)